MEFVLIPISIVLAIITSFRWEAGIRKRIEKRQRDLDKEVLSLRPPRFVRILFFSILYTGFSCGLNLCLFEYNEAHFSNDVVVYTMFMLFGLFGVLVCIWHIDVEGNDVTVFYPFSKRKHLKIEEIAFFSFYVSGKMSLLICYDKDKKKLFDVDTGYIDSERFEQKLEESGSQKVERSEIKRQRRKK